MLTVTERARKKLQEMLADKGEESYFRIFIQGFGWGGPRFDMTLEESVDEDDKVIDEGGIKFAFAPSVSRLLPGMMVDFIPGRFGGLVVRPGGGGCC